jgi:hypothetical protein
MVRHVRSSANRSQRGMSVHRLVPTEPVRWKPYDQMGRLEQKMFWAVREFSDASRDPLPEVDDPGSANEVTWPAERPADCARVLLEWFDAGLVGVMTTDGRAARRSQR